MHIWLKFRWFFCLMATHLHFLSYRWNKKLLNCRLILYTHYKNYTPIYIPRPEGKVVKLIITGKNGVFGLKKGKMRSQIFSQKKEKYFHTNFQKKGKVIFYLLFLFTFWILNQGAKKIEGTKNKSARKIIFWGAEIFTRAKKWRLNNNSLFSHHCINSSIWLRSIWIIWMNTIFYRYSFLLPLVFAHLTIQAYAYFRKKLQIYKK